MVIRGMCRTFVCAFTLFIGGVQAAEAPPEEAFAVVGNETISRSDYENNVAQAMRNRFYHGTPPAEEVEAFRREVAQQMVDRLLLAQEARRRGLKADEAWVSAQVEKLESRYRGNPAWMEQRDAVLPKLQQHYRGQALTDALKEAVQAAVAAPSEKDVRAYYKEHPATFTEPERVRVSMIMLGVAPGAGSPVWQAAEEQARGLVQQLKDGADFASLARKHSTDPSAGAGGALGFLHRGTVSNVAQEALDRLQPGMVSDPVVILEGVAIFRLDERRTATPKKFEEVVERATALLQRERKEQAWDDLIVALRAKTPVRFVESKVATPTPAGGMKGGVN